MTSTAAPETTRRPPASIAWFAFMTAMWWLLGLPWLLGAAVWESTWSEPLRIALVLVIALGWSWLSWPRRTSVRPKSR